MKRMRTATTALLATLLTLLPAAAHAQDDQRARLFNIEIIVFADQHPDRTSAELWRNDLSLRYPPELIELVPAADFDAVADSAQGSLLVNELSDPEMTAAYRKLRASRWMRPMFAGSWQQALQPTETAPNLLVTGGKRYGRYHELSGSIKVSLDRYLHIRSDLWRSEFQPRDAVQDMTTWPRMPLPFESSAADDENVPQFNPAVLRSGDWFDQDRYGRFSRTEMINAAWLPGGQPYFGNAKLDRESSANTRGKTTASRLRQVSRDFAAPEPWLLQRTVRLQQHRKMRSNELHYLDHPLFGVLIKITRADPSV